MFKKGQKVQQEFGTQVMEIVGFEPELIENVITRYEDAAGNHVLAKFPEADLKPAEESQDSK